MNREQAEETNLLAIEIGLRLGRHLQKLRSGCGSKEAHDITRRFADVMANILIEIQNPLYEEYPDLKPQELGGPFKVPSNIVPPAGLGCGR